ncbi:MAG: ABC transporter ATP-binding protein [Microthrixaceae bacterium]
MLIALLRTYLAAFKGWLVAVTVLQAGQTLATLMLPTLNADIIDNGIIPGDTGYIWRMGGWMLLLTLAQILLASGAVYAGSRTAMGFGRDVRGALFHKVTDFSTQEVSTLGAPSLITRVTNDVQQVQMLVLMGCLLMVTAPITAIGGIIMALRQDVGLSALLLVSIPVLLGAMSIILSKMVPLFRAMQERLDALNAVLREQLTGMRVVRAFVREPEERARFAVANGALTDTSLGAGRLMAYMFPTVMLVLNASSVAAIWLGAGRIDAGALQVGQLIAFLSYLIQILMAVMMATFMFVMAPRAAVSGERIQEVLTTDASISNKSDALVKLPSRTCLELRDVTFGYPGADEPVLSHIDLVAQPGETVAIIGSTGSGKTALLNLVPRLFDVTGGAVLVAGHDIREVDQEALWERVGFVPQTPFLFSGTVASNIRYGAPEASDEQVWEALRVAQAADFVAAMDGGLDARITQGGRNVSGGQRQRLAIARALVRNAGIYCFDDSFSALDLATEARLRAALAPRVADAVVLVVAQRVSTIIDADQILVLEDGQAVGKGTHDELLATCPTYAEIVASQRVEEPA